MSSSPPIIVNSIEIGSSSDSERISTYPSSPPATSTYSRQYNVTPTPEPRVAGLQESFDELRVSQDNVPEAEEDALVSDLNGLDIQSGLSLHSDHEDIPVYSLRAEGLPDAPIYDSKLQNSLRETKTRLSQLFSTIESCPLLSDSRSTLFALGQQIQRLSDFDYPRTRTVGLIGDSGVGKSSLVNSLLDEDGIARSSGDGGACTNIVTEYRYLPRGHEGNYYFEVDYMSSQEVTLLLEDLISTYRAYYTVRSEDIRDASERTDIRKKAERSAAALDSLFGDSPDYSEALLKTEGLNASQEILERLKGMVETVQRHRPGGLANLTWSGSAETIDDLNDQLDVFTRVESREELPVLWPFVSMIRIYLKSLFLRTGIILADLPGLRDLNYARVRATDQYMRSCHEVFAITRIQRAKTDEGIKDIVAQYGQRPIRIICTRSEEVNARETEISSPADAPQIRRLRAAVEKSRNQLIRLKNARRNNRIASSTDAAARTEVEISDELSHAEFNLDSFLIRRRNENVRHSLQEKYADTVFQNDLQVFCVSNTAYRKAQIDEITMAQPRVELSGIPTLRKYCQLIPAAAQFDAVTAFLEHQVPSLMGSIKQWLLQDSDGLSAELANTLRAALANSKSAFLECNSHITKLQRNLKHDFRSKISSTIEECATEWSDQALDANRQRAAWHHHTYSAFCRRNGDCSTETVGYHNWNDEIISVARPDLMGNCEECSRIACRRIDETVQAIRRIFDLQERALEQCSGLAPNAIHNLLANMDLRMSCIEDLVDVAKENFIVRFRMNQDDAVKGHPSSYTAILMRKVYLACQDESGKGSDARRKGHMKQRLSGPDLFLELRKLFRDAQLDATMSLINEIQSGVQVEMDLLLLDIQNVVCEEGAVSESQQYPETARNVQRLIEDLAQRMIGCHHLLSQLRGRRRL